MSKGKSEKKNEDWHLPGSMKPVKKWDPESILQSVIKDSKIQVSPH